MSFAMWADAVENAGTFYPPDVIKSYEAGRKLQSTVGEVYFRKEDHQLVRPVVIVRGKEPKRDAEQGGLLGGDRGRARRAADAEARRVRLQARRLHLSRTARSVLSWANFVSQLFNGLALGALLALISSGLTIIYGTLGVLNLAHGAMFMLGGYAGYAAYQATRLVPRRASSPARCALGVLGVVMERVIIRHFYARPHEDQLLVTFGLAIVFVEVVRWFFSSESQDRAGAAAAVRASPTSASCSTRPTAWRWSASARSRCWRCSSCSTARAWA